MANLLHLLGFLFLLALPVGAQTGSGTELFPGRGSLPPGSASSAQTAILPQADTQPSLVAVPGADGRFTPSWGSLPPSTASGLFTIPDRPADTVITANSMHLVSETIILEGNVRAEKAPDLLTAGKVFLGQDPRWMLATDSPRLFRQESIPEKQMMREVTVDARNIRWDEKTDTFNASDAVTVKIEERTWDLATYTWTIISAREMVGLKRSDRLLFHGNVKLKDKDHFGLGDHLDYDKLASTATLLGNAMLETEEWSEKEKRMVKRVLEGQEIRYNLDTKEMSSQ